MTALLGACYPRARLYGELYEPPVPPQGPGTPEDVLDALDAPTSVPHLACHGSAGTDPTASALHLTTEDGAEAELTVARLLERRAGAAAQDTADGPLVVLSACETDFSKRDHDEALTLATAFLSAGARDVVGSRWTARDSAAALMMAVFHHLVAVDGLSPVDALHVAQQWMLDPARRAPGSLSPQLLDELAKGPRLDHPADWAAFTHQGHPGPAGWHGGT